MNKAFTKEPDPGEPRCPAEGCGAIGQAVSEKTLHALLPPEITAKLPQSVYYCSSAECPIAYFNDWGFRVQAHQLKQSVFPKDPHGPICCCLAISAAQIREDAERGYRDRVRRIIEHAKSKAAQCLIAHPSGRSCVPEVRRLFLKNFSAGHPSSDAS